MAVRNVLQFGNPLLRRVAEEIHVFHSAQVLEILRDLKDTLLDLQQRHGMGGGLAAPQIGSSTRIIHINARGRSSFLLNPEIIDRSRETFAVWDFCFSARASFLALIERHRVITVRYQDENQESHTEKFEDYFSELLQHEIDHLNGKLFIDLIDRPDTITMIEEWDPANATQ